MTVFVDTSAWYAAADAGDVSHARAAAALSADEPLVTSDHVLVETWLLLRARGHRAAAESFWAALRTGAAQLEPVGPGDLEAAWAIGEVFADQDFSIVDRTSFAMMERLGIHRAASFDDDFAVYRFGPGRRKSFTIVR
ncbi:MAG: PIN domain-containing protein [Actinomycetota bacterium]|nr:PIN domain-containing protein [Actinomycetota bacterium]